MSDAKWMTAEERACKQMAAGQQRIVLSFREDRKATLSEHGIGPWLEHSDECGAIQIPSTSEIFDGIAREYPCTCGLAERIEKVLEKRG